MKGALQVAFMDPPKPKEQWIQLFPAGRWTAIDGRGPFFIRDPQAVIANSIRPKTDLVIDRDHQRFYKPQEQFVAAGWMKNFEVRNGEIWAKVEWTPYAEYQLAAKEYRYFSPQFRADKETGEIYSFSGGSICNDPAFELEAVASQQPKETFEMDEHLKKLIAALGLAATVTTEQLVASAIARLDSVKQLEADVASIRKAVGLDDKATGKDLVKKAEEMVASAKKAATGDKEPDPEKYVPMGMYEDVASRLKKLEEESVNEKAETIVAQALKDGKITPAQKEWAGLYARANYEGFKEFVANAPKVIDDAAASKVRKTAEGEVSKMNDDEALVASQLGLSEEQYLGVNKGEGKKAA